MWSLCLIWAIITIPLILKNSDNQVKKWTISGIAFTSFMIIGGIGNAYIAKTSRRDPPSEFPK